MNFYMSYWSGGYKKEPSEYVVDLHRLTLNYINKHYNECTLITDSKSKKYFEGMPFKTITTELDEINDVQTMNWALGKLIAYRNITDKKESFLHIDYDVFLLNPIPEEYLNSEVLVQSDEESVWTIYGLRHFNQYVKNRYDLSEVHETDSAYNMGIFGGTNYEFINYYAKEAIKFTLDPKNNEVLEKLSSATKSKTSKSTAPGCGAACTPEQYFLWNLAKKKNINVTCYLKGGQKNKMQREKDAVEKGYVHLMGFKDELMIVKEVYNRLHEFDNGEIK